MSALTIPILEFTRWHRWENRNSIADSQYPGVYVLAITNQDLEGLEVEYDQVCYIGMSNSKKGLKGRWGQFAQAIKGNRGRHSGGDTTFRHLGPYNTWDNKLFVAACPILCDPDNYSPVDIRNMGIVAYLEYEAFAQFSEKHPDLDKPKYNTK